MSVDPLGVSGGPEVQSQFSDAMQESALGKDDFMMLLMAQLQNQDPLKPMENTEFVAQLAQFSSLEQLTNMSDQLAGVQLGQVSTSNLQAASLVGNEITARGNHFQYDGTDGIDLNFELMNNADHGEISIYDEYGELVNTIQFNEESAGVVSQFWDGRTDSGTFAGAGRYRMEIQAFDADDNPIEASTMFTGQVTGIFFDQGMAELEVDGARVRLGDIVSIGAPQETSSGESGEGSSEE